MDSIANFVSYWYMRYLLVTELFMVEKWERKMFHIIAFILLILLTLFNNILVLGGVKWMRSAFSYYTNSPTVELDPNYSQL